MTALRVTEAAKQLVIRVSRGENQHSQCGGIAYVVRLRMPFSKAALQKRAGSMEPMEPPLDLPLTIYMYWKGAQVFDTNHKIKS